MTDKEKARESLLEVAKVMADDCLQGLPVSGEIVEVIPYLKELIVQAVRYGAEWMAVQIKELLSDTYDIRKKICRSDMSFLDAYRVIEELKNIKIDELFGKTETN